MFENIKSGYEFMNHQYSFASSGLPKDKSRIFNSRQEADNYRFKLESKYGLQLAEKYDDNHDKTYKYSNGSKIYIQRAY